MSTEGMKKLEKLYIKKINKRIGELSQRVWIDRTPVADVAAAETMEHLSLDQAKRLTYKPVSGGFRWGKAWSTAWFRLRVSIPKSFAGRRVNLIFRPEGECILFRDGVPVQGIDANHAEYLLTNRAKGGEKIELFVEAGASDAFGNFKVREMQQPEVAVVVPEMWDAWYDLQSLFEMAMEGRHWTGVAELSLPEDSTRRAKILFGVNKAVDAIDYYDWTYEGIVASAKRVKKILAPLFACPAEPSAQTVGCMGHSHIDVAWLWPLAETVRKCGRTFSTALQLMEEYPEYIFCQSQPHLYEYTRDRYPSLYKRIKEKVKKGQWSPTGCAWVEMDCNVTAGESLVRQILFGTRFYKKEFNYKVTSLWLPDVFGYSAALPQLLKRSGIDYFLTQKISWSQFTVFPHHTFMWEGLDGTQVLSHFLPSNDYNAKLKAPELITAANRYRQKDRSPLQASLYGWGDGGGGPTKEMLERMRRYKNLEGVPKLQPMSAEKFFKRLEAESVDLPKWIGELYLEFHRGTLTTMSMNKKNNRKSELTLRQAEMLASLTMLLGQKYPQAAINDAWKTVLLNQFHDIIPGSSIAKVYEDSDKDYAGVLATANEVRDASMAKLAQSIDTQGEGSAVVAFNSLGWDRSDIAVAEVKGLKKGASYVAVGPDGSVTPAQVGFDGKVRFVATVPSIGHAVYHIKPGKVEAADVKATEKVLENSVVRVKFDAKGRIVSVFDKQADRETVAPGKVANEFILFEDKPSDFDAWDVDIFYNDKPLECSGELVSSEVVESGPVRSVIRQVRKISKSTITQYIVLMAGSKRVDFQTSIEWAQEREVLLKVAFPVDVRSDVARYDVQFGNLERPTHWNTPKDFAQFEVTGHKWVDLSETGYGVAVLNDCKYGHDIHGDTIRISLLRATTFPNTTADVNLTHTINYAMLPHLGDFTNGVVRNGYELNVPVQAVETASSKGKLAKCASNFSITGDNVVIETIKKAEDDDAIIVRLYEAHGARGRRTFRTSLPVRQIIETNLMEVEEKKLTGKNGAVTLEFTPYQIRTLKLKF